MNTLALYQISEQYRDALETLGDLDLPDNVVTDTLLGLSGDLKTKATNVAMYSRNLESLAEQIKKAEETMSHRRKVLENRAESIREYIRSCMETAGIQKISCDLFELAVVKNPPSVEIVDESAIDESFKRLPTPPPLIPDKKLILEALKNGLDVAGTKLVQKTRLRIK